MSKSYLIGIDIGTQSARAGLFDTQGELAAIAAEGFELDTPLPGWAQQDARLWWDASVRNIRSLFSQTGVDPQIACVGISAQMHAAIPLGREGQVLVPAVQLWCDKRSAEIIDRYRQSPGVTDGFQRSANQPVPAWQGFKIKWVQQHQPEVYARTWKFLTAGAYLVYQLTGKARISLSEASGSFLMNARNESWDEELIRRLEIDPAKLPMIAPATSIAGTVTAEAARLTGLLAGTPVSVGAADMMALLLSAGLTGPGRAVDSCGTASLMSVFSAQPVMDPRLMNLHHELDGWVSFGIIDSGGGALRWFRDKFCQAEVELARQTGRDPYDLMTEKAARVEPGSEGLLFFPYLLGERTLGSPYSRGVFFGLTPRSDPAQMTRAILEGVTFELRRTLEIVEASGAAVAEIRAVGGGGDNPTWNQIRADIYGKPIVQLARHPGQGGVLGMAMLAGVAAGVWPDVPAATDAILKIARRVLPIPANRERYEKLYAVFKALHESLIPPA